MRNQNRRKWEASGEYVPEKVLLWKRYADPINEALMNKYRDTINVDNTLIEEEPKVVQNFPTQPNGRWQDL